MGTGTAKSADQCRDKKVKQIFYTALYHTYLAPTIFSDRYGNYKGVKGEIYNGKMVLTTNSLWDTFRAANPLLNHHPNRNGTFAGK